MSDPLDPNATARRINDLRTRYLAGEQIQPEEYAEIIAALRADRQRAAAPAPKKARQAAQSLDPDILFS